MTINEKNTLAISMEENETENNNYERPLINGCEDKWSWSKRDRSKEVWLSGPGNRTVHFHPK
jgi:SPRY domain-containing SOCS box protein 3